MIVLVFLGIGAVCLRFFLGPWLAERSLEKVIRSSLGETATVERTKIHWMGRPGIEYHGLSMRKTGAETDWVRINRIVVRPRLGSLFSRSLRWKSLELDHPVVRLSEDGRPFPPGPLGSILSQFDYLSITGGRIEWPDREIQELSVSSRRLSADGRLSVVLKGAIMVGDASPAWVSIQGLVHEPLKKWDLSNFNLSGQIEAEGLDLQWLGGLLVRDIPSELVGGRVTVAAKFDGNFNRQFQSSGTVSLAGCRLVDRLERLRADFSLTWDGQELEFEKIRLRSPSIPLEGKGRIFRKPDADPVLSFQMNCPWVSIREWARVMPALPEKVRSFLESIQNGEVALASVGYTGPFGSLRFPENDESLFCWRGRVRFRNLTFPCNGETLELKEGSVRIDHGSVVAEAVRVGLGGSELEISGLALSKPFSDRSLDLTVVGEVTLTDIPKWISMGPMPESTAVPISDIEVLSGTGNVHLRIQKSLGLSHPPVINGKLVLHDATIRIRHFPDTFEALNGSFEVSPGGLVLREVHGRWRDSTVSARGLVSDLFSHHPQIECSLMGRLDLRDLSKLASWEGLSMGVRQVLHEVVSPMGEGDYVLVVKGPLGLSENMEVRGELSVREGSFRLWNAYPVEGVRGRILLSNDRISVPDLRGIWKNSNLALRALLTGQGVSFLRNLTFSATFDLGDIASEEFDHGGPRIWKRSLKPFEFRGGRALLEVTERKKTGLATVEGRITFEDATVRYVPVFPPLTGLKGNVFFDGRGLKTLDVHGRLDSDPVRIEGHLIQDSGDSVPNLFIQAEKIDLEKVLSWPWSKGVFDSREEGSPLAVHVRADRGTFREIPLSDVEVRLRLRGDRISFEKVTFVSGEGYGLITGWIRFGKDDKISLEFRPYLANLEADPILTSFQRVGSKRQLTGVGSATGVIRASGQGIQGIARSLSGEVRLSLEDGSIAQFNVLSKVFSFLDFWQLLRGNLPDLKTAGMRYRNITGHISLKEGRASTSDLLLDSDSMRISTAGTLDIASGGLDLRLGLARFGAEGKIVRTVPFLGPIVTKEGGSFIYYYLEVKGTIDKPEVKSIPLESVREGILATLQKLFEKPVEWFHFQRRPDFDQYDDERENRYP